ncbi:hypothetical protein HYY74_07655 [Candidatus Woesearchaeota archaeon]|nr:hypothetical protein [Candidatus Woesearchaeota archaeon]
MATFKAKLLETIQETPRVKLLRFARPASFDFKPGQFITASIEGLKGPHGETVKRSYSIASSPHDKDYIELCVARAETGLFSNALHKHKHGEEVIITGPYGVFQLREPVHPNTTFVAGGSGIAPIRSMIRTHMHRGEKTNLFYGFRSPEEFIYRKELTQLAAKGKIKLFLTIDKPAKGWKDEVGYVSELPAKHANYEKTDAYICGPPAMVTATIKALTELGFDQKRIYREQW